MVTLPFRAGCPTLHIPSGRRHIRTGRPPCRHPMTTTSGDSQAPPFRRVPSSRRPGSVRMPPPEGRGYRKVRLSGGSCLSGERRSPFTGYFKDSTKRPLSAKMFCKPPFYMIFSLNASYLRAFLTLDIRLPQTHWQMPMEIFPSLVPRHGFPWPCLNNSAHKSAKKPRSGKRNLAVDEVRKAHVTHGKTREYK